MKRTALLLSWVVGLLVAIPAQAQQPSTDEIAKALRSNPVYVFPGLEGTTSETGNELGDQLREDDNILIVMLPAIDADLADLASKLDNATQHEHIIGLAAGDAFVAVSANMPKGVAADLMQRAESISTSNIETMSTFIRNVHTWQARHPDAKASKPTKKKDGSSLWYLSLFALAVTIISFLVTWRYRTNQRGYETSHGFVQFKSSPEQVRNLLDDIMRKCGDITDREVRGLVDTACSNTEEYFRRASANSKHTADAQTFVRHLQSLREVIVRYIDIQNYSHRGYYDEPEKLMAGGRKAIEGYNTFVLDSIKRGRSAELTDFKVNTDILSAQQFR